MKREEFIKWLENSTGFTREYNDCDDTYWEEEVDYANMVRDYLEVENDDVVLSWEEWYWGGINYRKDRYEFEEFIERYKNYTLKF
jgi:hypothetical protein